MTSRTTNNDLQAQLLKLGLRATAEQLDDLIARATRKQLSPRTLLEEIAAAELSERAARSLHRLLLQARIGRFKPISDFDWSWPKKIDRELLERALTLDFIPEARNLILIGANGLGKTKPHHYPY
jgi:DNA replication protein DnaC